MDLGAYCNIGTMEDYVVKNYGDVPRLRGIRLMKLEEKTGEGGPQMGLSERERTMVHALSNADEGIIAELNTNASEAMAQKHA